MDNDIIVSGVVGIVASVISGFTSFIWTRKKYSKEVEAQEIENKNNIQEFYERVAQDNKEQLKFYMDKLDKTNIELYRLRTQVQRLLNCACLDIDCRNRVFFTPEQVKGIIGNTSNIMEDEDTK